MADSKITALTAISTVDPTADPLVIVDVSDTSMAASGTTKKSTINQILGAGGTATLASATITGALTVQSNVNAPANVSLRYGPSGATWAGLRFDATNQTFLDSDIALIFRTGGATSFTTAYQIGATGISTWSVGGSTAMTLNSTGLGVGVTPSAGRGAVQLSAGIGFPATQVASSDANTLDDYEEGSWVPTLNSGTFSSASCRYTKIGNMVTIFFDVTVGTGGGDRITNLPFAAASTSTVANGIYTNNQTYAAGTTAPVVVVGGSSSTLFFRTVGTGVAFSAMTFTAAANLTGSISYFV